MNALEAIQAAGITVADITRLCELSRREYEASPLFRTLLPAFDAAFSAGFVAGLRVPAIGVDGFVAEVEASQEPTP